MCTDSFIDYLKQVGFSVIRLPRRDFHPLLILMRQGKDLVTLGELATVIVPGAGAVLPAVKEDAPASAVSGQRTSDLSVGVGLSILGSVIGAMGGGSLGLDAKYRSAKSIAFEFTGVLMDSLEIAALDKFLGASDVDPNSRHVAELLEADEVYVVTATIKSKEFTVDAKGEGGANVALEVPEIEQVVGGKVRVARSGTTSSKITYAASASDEPPLVFGFQAVRLFYDEGHYTAFEPLPSGKLAARELAASPLPPGVQPFQSAGIFTRLARP
jgi:hypothetical protein